MKKILLYIGLSILLVQVCSADPIYIDCQNGNDSNNGSTSLLPIKTIANLNANFTVNASDIVYFNRGVTCYFGEDAYPSLNDGAAGNRATWRDYGAGTKPKLVGGSRTNFTNVGANLYLSTVTSTLDIGHVACNDHFILGDKQNYTDLPLNAHLEFLYNGTGDDRTLVYSTTDLTTFSNCILAQEDNMFDIQNIEYQNFYNLTLYSGGQHGIGGSGADYITVAGSEFWYIGGAFQSDITCLRYGNGIEFGQSSSNNYVRNNKFVANYDSAITSQSWSGVHHMSNTRFYNNLIINCTYGIEHFMGDAGCTVTNFEVDHNTIYGTGRGFGLQDSHTTAMGLRFSEAQTGNSNVSIHSNIIANSSNREIVLGNFVNNWRSPITINYNRYVDDTDNINYVNINGSAHNSFVDFQTNTDFEDNGSEGFINFVDEVSFQPQYGEAVCTMSETGSYVGYVDCGGGGTTNEGVWWNSTNETQGFVSLTYTSPIPYHDTFEFYTGGVTLSDNWNINSGSWYINNSISNGFSGTTNMVCNDNPNGTREWLTKSLGSYDDFEVIVKTVRQSKNVTEETIISLYNAPTHSIVIKHIAKDEIWFYDNNSVSHVKSVTLDLNTTLYFRIVKNDTNFSFYYSMDFGKTFTLGLNYTSDFVPIDLNFANKYEHSCFDNVIIRELITDNRVYQGETLIPSYIYTSSNSSAWDYTRYRWNIDGIWQSYQTKLNPTDWDWADSQTISTPGQYYMQVQIFDTTGTSAYNNTQTIVFGTGNLNISIYDEQTRALITNRTITLDVIGSRYGFNNNYTTTNGLVTINNITVDSYEIRYEATGYHPRTYYFTFPSQQNHEVDLYLLNDSSSVSDRVIITLKDQDTDVIENMTIKQQRNYIINGSSSFITVGMTRTNFEGEGVLYVEMYDVWYRLIYEDSSGLIREITNPSPFFSTTPTDFVNLEEDDYLSWRQYGSIFGNVSFLNSSGIIYGRFIFSDSSNLVRTGCLKVQHFTANGVNTICNNCTSSASATLTCVIDHTATGQYSAIGLVDTNTTNSFYALDSDWFTTTTSRQFLTEGVFFTGVMVGSIMLMGIGSLTSSIVFLLLGVIGTMAMSFVTGLKMSYIYYWVILGAIIIFLVNKKNK